MMSAASVELVKSVVIIYLTRMLSTPLLLGSSCSTTRIDGADSSHCFELQRPRQDVKGSEKLSSYISNFLTCCTELNHWTAQKT